MMENTLNYKGYFTNVEYSAEDKVLHGKIEGIDDLVTFESESAENIESEFQSAVDDYIEYCKKVGKEPDKTYKGTFNVRISPALHKEIALKAARSGVSLNQAVEYAIAQYVQSGNADTSDVIADIDSKLSEINVALNTYSRNWQTNNLDPNYSYYTNGMPTVVCLTEGE